MFLSPSYCIDSEDVFGISSDPERQDKSLFTYTTLNLTSMECDSSMLVTQVNIRR